MTDYSDSKPAGVSPPLLGAFALAKGFGHSLLIQSMWELRKRWKHKLVVGNCPEVLSGELGFNPSSLPLSL